MTAPQTRHRGRALLYDSYAEDNYKRADEHRLLAKDTDPPLPVQWLEAKLAVAYREVGDLFAEAARDLRELADAIEADDAEQVPA